MLTYPQDATINALNYPTTGVVTYYNTGANSSFVLSGRASSVGAVMPIVDSTIANQDTYYLSNNGANVNFYIAPEASELRVFNLDVPASMLYLTTTVTSRAVEYSNNIPVTINGNVYVVNGTRTTWSLPEGIESVQDKQQIIVSVNSAIVPSDFTYPSTTLGYSGLDITPALSTSARLQVRTIGGNRVTYVRSVSMENRKPDRGFPMQSQYAISPFTPQIPTYTRSRLISRRKQRVWTLTYGAITGLQKQAIENFFDLVPCDDFLLDLTHLNETGTVTVKLEGGIINFSHILSGNPGNLGENFYSASFSLREI